MRRISMKDILIHSSSKITYYGKHKLNIGRNVCMLCLNTNIYTHAYMCVLCMTKYSKQQKVENRTRKIKTNENETDRQTDARAVEKRAQKRLPITCSECTTRAYKYKTTIHVQPCICIRIHTHTQGMLGKARAHEGNKLTSTRNGVNSIHKMHYQFQNMFVCMYL